ncbi:MAG: hypothetical protein ABIY71_06455, partial [Flavobacteriales bacterium]
PMIVLMLTIGAIAMGMFLAFKGAIIISHAAFFLWGLAFGPLVTMYQTAVSKQVDAGKDVATSVQSSVFNLSIMAATWIGGILLINFPATGVQLIVWMSVICFVLSIIIAYLSKHTLRSSPVVSTEP